MYHFQHSENISPDLRHLKCWVSFAKSCDMIADNQVSMMLSQLHKARKWTTRWIRPHMSGFVFCYQLCNVFFIWSNKQTDHTMACQPVIAQMQNNKNLTRVVHKIKHISPRTPSAQICIFQLTHELPCCDNWIELTPDTHSQVLPGLLREHAQIVGTCAKSNYDHCLVRRTTNKRITQLCGTATNGGQLQ